MFKSIKYHFYIFQLENYEIKRFLRYLYKFKYSIKHNPRQQIVWTIKARLIFSLAVILHFLLAAPSLLAYDRWDIRIILYILWWFVFLNLYSIFYILASILLWPADFLAKSWMISRGKRKLRQFPDLKIIGITGSYGKTTMKEALTNVLAEKYQVLQTPENINTPVGIARLVLSKLNAETQIFIVEMGAYHRGDIKGMCKLAPPDIAILTGINEAHLERFGGIDNTIKAKFEIVDYAKPKAFVVLNADSELVVKNYQAHLRGRPVAFYTSYKAKNVEFVWGPSSFLPLNKGELEGVQIATPILGEYIFGVISALLIIGRHLNLSGQELGQGVAGLRPIKHRLEPIYNPATEVMVIDDSYNGNPAGAREAIDVLGKFRDRRKIYVTPGLVEMAERSRMVHQEIGERLGKVADKVILIKNSVTPYIAEGLAKSGFALENILWFASREEAHGAMGQVVQQGDVVLFQNDWPDNYL